ARRWQFALPGRAKTPRPAQEPALDGPPPPPTPAPTSPAPPPRQAPKPPPFPPGEPPRLIHVADLPEPAPAAAPAAAPPPAPARPASRPAAPPSAARAPRPRRLSRSDLVLLDAVRAAEVVEARPVLHLSLALMLLAVLAAGLWAGFTRVEQITRADARVVPEGREQVIASLEGGLLAELLVGEGAQVSPGQALVRLDPTRFEAQQNEGQAKRLALLASIARLRAEANGQPLRFPPELQAHPRLRDAEAEAYTARRRLLDETAAATRHSIGLVLQELDVAQRMAAQGLASDLDVVRLKRQVNDLRQQLFERSNRLRQDASTELLARQTELAQLDEQLVAREDAVRRTLITSPVRGLVKNIRVNTVGGVIGPGAPIMEIVPVGERLRVEARIKPADIGFVRVGQTAQVKLSAYDPNLYGMLQGEVVSLSPDALGSPDAGTTAGAGAEANTWYRAIVRIDHSTLQARGEQLPVIPGMTGSVEINTGERTVMDFILRPLLKAREAFRER
ncbi:HlyD family type I secretion periplasmic adaptor subunit, partial [Ideonella livida]